MHHPERWTFDWFYKRHDMDKADNRVYRQTETERRAEELHEGCRMPMGQARELAASEANPAAGAMLSDWYARGQDWALADAMTGSLPNDWTAGDIARAYAAGARAGEGVLAADVTRLVDKCNSYIVDNARLAEQVENLRAALAVGAA